MLSKFLLDLFFPALCQGCRVEGSYLCSGCEIKLTPVIQRCFICEKGSLLGRTHPNCASPAKPLSGIMVSCSYQDEGIRNLIWHFKYNSIKAIAEILSLLMTDYFMKEDLIDYFSGCAVMPVPLHKKRLRLRGYNQAELLAEFFAKKLGYQYLPGLVRTKNTRSQVELVRQERFKNVQDLFQARPGLNLAEKRIILVDDVATTGATLNECAKVLTQFQPSEIWGLVVARN